MMDAGGRKRACANTDSSTAGTNNRDGPRPDRRTRGMFPSRINTHEKPLTFNRAA
jgi:hypothetical protein